MPGNASPVKKIPILDTCLVGNEKKYVLEAIESGWVSSKGPFVGRFEQAFAEYLGIGFASSCSNGTAALHLAYQACGIKAGDEIIVPNLTFVATANAAAYLGAKPVFVDVDPNTWNMDPSQIEKKITSKTKAIVPVHLYGCPCDMKPIVEIGQKHGLRIIEDCAEAPGAQYRGKKAGTFGDCAAFSFFGNKIITTGEGGMVVSDDADLIECINFLKNHGQQPGKSYWHTEIAYNYRMTALQAAFGLGQLEGIETLIEKKIRIREYYEKKLAPLSKLRLQKSLDKSRHVAWLNSLVTTGTDIGKFRDFLNQNGIETRPLFYPLNSLPMFKTSERFPVTDLVSKTGLSLPSGANLTQDQLEKIVSLIADFFGKQAHS